MPEPAKPNRYELPITSMVGAMLVVIGVVAAFVVWRAVNRDNAGVTTPTVDYKPWVQAGRQDGRLTMLTPPRLPDGWRATSATYGSGASPHWHLGVLTGGGDYLGLEEGLAPLSQQVHDYVDADAKRGEDVRIGGVTWRSYTDPGGDYAVVRHQRAPKGRFPETVVVVGSATPAQVREYAGSLR